ncbi:DUF1002 domain-containing protein [Staphylococcus chromogenes]|uniref:DUF1002 domain-containing protein n=1 Tax=Staphylococcus chromogenes TaxID=46126 RepID=UPI00188F0A22|nr:DUF1002 domain-containing protein [Staphylococcus chromogenes]
MKNHYKKIIVAMTLSIILSNNTIITESHARTTSDNDRNNSHQLEKSLYIEGADLNPEQEEQTKTDLGVKDDYQKYEITTDDVSQYTGGTYNYIYSSATIVPKKFRKGVDVQITTPKNITRITEAQYTNAAITSGIENASIKVASVQPVTGEGALTGIYKALEKEGVSIYRDDIQKANEEMETLASINESQKKQGNEINEPLNNAVADMKEQVAEKKVDGESVSQQDIHDIVNETLKEKGLNSVLDDSQKQQLVTVITNISQTNIMETNPESIKEQASQLKDGLSDNIKDFNDENDGILERLWSNIKEFFSALSDKVMQFFNSLF